MRAIIDYATRLRKKDRDVPTNLLLHLSSLLHHTDREPLSSPTLSTPDEVEAAVDERKKSADALEMESSSSLEVEELLVEMDDSIGEAEPGEGSVHGEEGDAAQTGGEDGSGVPSSLPGEWS